MSTNSIASVRRENLRRLVEQHGGATSVGKRLGHSGPSYISQMVSGIRPITEKTARKIEQAFSLEERALDQRPGEGMPFAGTDRALFTAVIRVVGEELERARLKPAPAKFAELVAMTYEKSVPAGTVDLPYLRSLLNLLS